MVETEQVQDPMDRHMRPMRPDRFRLFTRLLSYHRRADHELAKEAAAIRRAAGSRKRQHVCGPVPVPVLRVQATTSRLADDSDREHRRPSNGCERSRGPAQQLSRVWDPRTARRIAHIEFEPPCHRLKDRRRMRSPRRLERFFVPTDGGPRLAS